MENHDTPKISANLTIDPATHSFTSAQAPSLVLTVISHHPDPITIYADDLSPRLMLSCGAFNITDLTTGTEVPQTRRTHCKIPPPTKVAVALKEHLFYTLYPNTPIHLSTPFTRSRSSTGGKPLAKDDPDYPADRAGNHGACGVDGLEPGHRYALSLASKPRVHWNSIRWWEYGVKEQVLRGDGEGGGLDGRRVQFGRAPHETIELDLASIGTLEFECQE